MGKPRLKPNNNNNSQKSKFKVGVFNKGVHKSTINNNNNNNNKKSKASSLKNQIRSTQRFLLRDLPAEVREAQEKKLDELKKEQLDQNRLAEERKNFLRDKKIKFFERRKIERRLRRTEKQQRVSLNEDEEKKVTEELHQLKNDLEYVRFFPKTEKYVPLFCGNEPELEDSRNRLRMQIKANIIAAAASGKDLEETGSEDDGPIDLTDDDFFVSGSSSDEADADDELTDLSAREQASTAPTSAALGMSTDQSNKRQKSAQSLMPPPRPQKSSAQRFDNTKPRSFSKNPKTSHSSEGGFRQYQTGQSSNGKFKFDNPEPSKHSGFRHGQAGQSSNRFSNFDNTKQSTKIGFRHAQAGPSGNRSSNSDTGRHTNDTGFQNSQVSQSSNISSNSDAPAKKPRKRRPKKRKQ